MEASKTKEPKIAFFNSKTYFTENTNKLLLFYDQVVSKLEEIESSPTIKRNVYTHYFNLEQELLKEISQYKPKKHYKDALNEILYEHFFKYDSDKRLKEGKTINFLFATFLSTINLGKDLKKYFNRDLHYLDEDKSEFQAKELKTILKEMENGMFDECISYIMSHTGLESVPYFLINKGLIKQKVSLIWRINYSIPINNIKMKSQFGYQYLSELFMNFLSKKAKLFDLSIFDKKTLGILFKCFFLSNLEYLQMNEHNYNKFKAKLNTYLAIMNLNKSKDYELINNYFIGKCNQFFINGTKSQLYNEIKILFEELKKLLTEDYRILITEKGSEKMIIIIFSFSLMLNNLIDVDWNSKEISLNPNLKCSACERQFLLHFLSNIDIFVTQSNDSDEFVNSSLYVNYFLEKSIFSNLIKAASVDLFDSSVAYKTRISFNTMINRLQFNNQIQLGKEGSDTSQEGNEDYFNELINAFCTEYKESNNSFWRKLEDQIALELIPHDPVNVSTHICLCINNYYDAKVMDQLNNESKLVDYYYFSWNEDKKNGNPFKSFFNFLFINEKGTIERNTKLAGKFLAYILSSRKLFHFHTFSFIGISHGANVIKHCLTELSNMKERLGSFRDLINDIVFINGRTQLKQEDLKSLVDNVSGRIVNVYSNHKEKESKDFICSNEIKYEHIENYDLSHLAFTSDEYKININKILTKINFK